MCSIGLYANAGGDELYGQFGETFNYKLQHDKKVHKMADEEFQGIPINPSDLPIDAVTMEESQVYPAILEKATIAMRLSKKDVLYCAVQVSIPDGDYEGMIVSANYLALPIPLRPESTKKDKIHATNIGAPFARFSRSFKLPGGMPQVSLARPDTVQAWQKWIAKAYGNRGKIMIKNQEFPEGSGRMRSGISDFVF